MSGKRQGKQNLQALFEVKETPSDNQIRNLLDPLEPTEFAPQHEWIWQQLSRLGGLKPYQTSLGTRLIALIGTLSGCLWTNPWMKMMFHPTSLLLFQIENCWAVYQKFFTPAITE